MNIIEYIKTHFLKYQIQLENKIYFKTEVDNLIKNVDVDTSTLMKKDIYDNDADGVVDKSLSTTKIEGIEETPFFSVYGKSPNGETGFYEFPIGVIDENTNKFQSVRQNALANNTYAIDLIRENKINDLIVQAYEFHEGEQDIVTTLREFNNTDSSNFYYDEAHISFEDGMKIKNNFKIKSTLNSDNFYEIDLSNFIDIKGINEGGNN